MRWISLNENLKIGKGRYETKNRKQKAEINIESTLLGKKLGKGRYETKKQKTKDRKKSRIEK